MDAMGMKSAFFAADLQKGGMGGCIIDGIGNEPANTGSLVYLNGGEDIWVLRFQNLERPGAKLFCRRLQLIQMVLWNTLKIQKETRLVFIQENRLTVYNI
jgi:hypothetical protein